MIVSSTFLRGPAQHVGSTLVAADALTMTVREGGRVVNNQPSSPLAITDTWDFEPG